MLDAKFIKILTMVLTLSAGVLALFLIKCDFGTEPNYLDITPRNAINFMEEKPNANPTKDNLYLNGSFPPQVNIKKLSDLPSLDPNYPPLSRQNKALLFDRLTLAFDFTYNKDFSDPRNFSDDFMAYYLRQELQALLDMYVATQKGRYLGKAKQLVFQAISDAKTNPRIMYYHGQNRGSWPCFLLESVLKDTGGHNQLNDFQGAAGFMMVAVALKQNNQPGWREIADFVEKFIIEKWLYFNPEIKQNSFLGPESNTYLLAVLDGARDKREHFTTICLDLHKLGYTKLPYEKWAKFFIKMYLGEKKNTQQSFFDPTIPPRLQPKDWGVIPENSSGGYVWYWKSREPVIQDTSHANRTVWLACEVYSENLLDANALNRFVNTFKKQIWAPDKNTFHFNNFIDGNDPPIRENAPGFKGNVWFGWHRLAAYDTDLRNLFISLAYELTKGGQNIPPSQNKTMKNAPICFYAWAARLLAENDIHE
ncbi:hypothetical protein ACFL02_10440 [Planctomycetota bacterium]